MAKKVLTTAVARAGVKGGVLLRRTYEGFIALIAAMQFPFVQLV